jgi:hypothetical protein
MIFFGLKFLGILDPYITPMDMLDTYYELNKTQQKKINLKMSIDAGYLIDIRGHKYT